jgi:hypothetical protein
MILGSTTKHTAAEWLVSRVGDHVRMFRDTSKSKVYSGAGAVEDVENVFTELVQQARANGALSAYASLLTSDPTKYSEEFIAESTYAATRAIGDNKVQILLDGVSVLPWDCEGLLRAVA